MLATRMFFWWDAAAIDPMTPVRIVPATARVFEAEATSRVFQVAATDRIFVVPAERP